MPLIASDDVADLCLAVRDLLVAVLEDLVEVGGADLPVTAPEREADAVGLLVGAPDEGFAARLVFLFLLVGAFFGSLSVNDFAGSCVISRPLSVTRTVLVGVFGARKYPTPIPIPIAIMPMAMSMAVPPVL